MRKFIFFGVLIALTTLFGQLAIAQLSVDNLDQTYTIDFDNTVAGVNEDVFNGGGFASTPAAGQLDADAWAVEGMSDGNKPFGVENTTGDHARGTSVGGETTGGVWAFEVEAGNYALGVQPGGSDFTPGYFGFVLQNNSGSDVNFIEFSYDIWVYNDADRANSFNGEFSLDGINWGPIPEMEFTTPELLDDPVAWVKTEMAVAGFFGTVLPDGGYLYFRWNSDDVSGSGSRDEIGLDNIQVVLSYKNLVTSYPFIETFEETSTTRDDWTQIQEQGNKTWTFVNGDGGGTITTAYEGSLNAKFTSSTYAGDKTKLVSPFMDLTSTLAQPMLTFWYGQSAWGSDQNELKVYYRTDVSEPWIELAHYVDNVDTWTEESLLLPNMSSSYQIAFEGIDNYGYANVVDFVTIKDAPTGTPDWCNLQWPPTMELSDNGSGTVYAQVYEPGVTDAPGQGAGIEAWIGYSEDNTDPATWTNWVAATYNDDNGNNDEYMADIGPFPVGTYYYASRFSLEGGPMVYGGYSESGGNFWDGIDYVSGVLNVAANVYTLPLFEDFELGFSFFANPAKSTDWTLNTTVYYSAAQSAHNAYGSNDDNVLYQTGNIDLTATVNPELSFWQIAKTEGDYDFCYIEFSTDGGASWNIIPEAAYMGDGVYEVAGFSASGECFDEDAYAEWGTGTETPDNTWWKKEVFSLADYITSNEFRVRFRLGSDGSAQRAGWYLDDIMIKDVTCPNPSDLAVFNITEMDADVSWTAGDTETLWNILYGEQGFDIDTEGTLETGVGNPFNINPLTESTAYDVYVQADCGGGDFSEWVGPITFSSLANCPEPTDLAAANIGLTNADLSWTAAIGTDTWNAEVGAVGFTPGNSEELFSDIGNTTAAWPLTGLTEGTDYQLYVQTDCGGGTTSTWAGPYDFSTLTPGGSCETAIDYGAVNDPAQTGSIVASEVVWYYVTLTQPMADVAFSLCNSDYDTKLEVWEDCGDATYLYYNDDSYAVCGTSRSYIEAESLDAGTYYVKVYAYGSSFGNYELEITGITCAEPTDLAAANITQTSAEISWTQGLNETLWNVLYGPTGFDILTEGTQVDGVTSPYEINTLTENSTYDVYVQSDCGGGDFSEWVGPVSFTTLASCPEPTDLTATTIGLTTADLSWTAAVGTDTWNAEVGAVGFTPGNSEELFSDIGNTSAAWPLTGLTEGTDYQLYVQTDCGGGITSTWAGPYDFSTLTPGGSCATAFDYGAVNDPEVTGIMEEGGAVWYYITLAEDYANVDISLCGSDFDTKLAVFEDCADFVSIPPFGAPDGNLAYNDDAPGTYCSTDLNQSLVEFDILPAGTYYILVYPYGSNSGTYGLEITGVTCLEPTDLAAANITQTSAEISWTQGWNETLWNVLYGPTGFDILTEGTQVDGVTSPYEINTLTENSTYDVYVQSDCGGGDYSDWAGPVTFTTLAGCAAPINLYAANITSESADLGWEAVGGTDTWNVELGLPGFTPGNGEELVLVTETNDNPVYVDGGSPNTTYQFYVQSVCGAETSDWAGPFEFSSECETVSVFPLTENFDGDWTSWCWDVINNDSDAYTWTQNNAYITPTHSPLYAAHGMGNQDDYLITPALLLDDNMIMTWWDKVESSSYPNRYYVKLSTTGKNPADFTEELGYFDCTNTAWTQHDIDLSTYSGQTVYIAFHQTYSQATNWGFGIDDFEIRQLSDENDIISFVLAEQTGDAVITGAPDYTVDIEVAMGTDLNGLIPTITVSPFASIDPESGLPQDFNSPVVYTVTSEAGTEQEWTVNVTESSEQSSENDIVDFVLPEQTGAAVIMGDPDYTVEIEVAWNADITNLTPTIVVSPLATISPESGVAQDFTNPVVYTVIAEDGTEQEWTATVTKEDAPAGITCDDPIVVSIPAEAPYLDEDQSNCGFGANYTETCLGSYGNGDGIVYRLDVTEASYVYIDLTTTSTWTGIALLDDCPDVGECIAYETGSGGNESIEAALMPGSYYILISTYPAPNCIPSFDLAITVDNNVCLSPVGLAVVDLWQDEATIEWEAGFLETSFNVLYGEAGFDPATEGTLISGVTSPYTIESLTASTEYDVYVQADCDSDWTSISFTTLAACPAPIELYADNITHESADLGWNAVGGTDTWNVEYGEAGFTQGEGTLISATTDNPVFVDGLEQDTEYQFYVQSVCGAENSVWAGPFSFTSLEACPTPDELYAINLTAESADLGWLETGVATEWNVEVGAPGFAVGTGAEIVGVMGTTDNPVFVDGLAPATTYEFYVQADCGDAQSYWAGPFEFTTLCETFELPFEEDFTGLATGSLPNCWSETNTHWGVVDSDNAGGTAPEMRLYWSPSYTGSVKLITPVINANDVVELDLSFVHMVDHFSNSYDIKVEISTNYGTDWTEVWSVNVSGDVIAETVEVNLDAYAGNDVMIAWVFEGYTFDIDAWYIDNINLTGVEPVFPEIAGIDVNNEVEDVSLCLGALESEALAQLVEEITISDSDGGEHVVALSWTIDAFDGDVADTYTATGTFELPDGVVQTDPETTLEVYADVVVNELPVVTCPDEFTVTTAEPVELTGEDPEGGVYSGTGVTDGIFDPDGLVNDDYVITYTYEDPATGCENSCEFTITVNIDINVEINSLSDISIYPNPNNGLFVMDLSNIEGEVYYKIYDTKGSVIISNEFVNYGGVEEFNLDVAPGIYYIQLRNAEQTINKKIVVQ
jgi:hypothetical protein